MYGRRENRIMSRSDELFERAVKVIPGGVNSPVRAYGSVGMTPRFIEGASGPYVVDADSKKYIDYISSWGPMILGHNNQEVLNAVIRKAESGLSFGAATEIEVEMAEFICENIPSIEMIRMVNSGTEAVMSAIRAARGYTRRDKIVKFTGCYHGHSDALLVKAGSGVMTAGIPDSAGVPAGCTQDTLSAIYNDLASVEALFAEYPKEIAAVIVEPVAANMGVVPPKKGFLEGLRKFCSEHGSVLIFDEVITGFRLGLQGAQGYFGIDADLVTYGKIIGAGMPVGAYGGKREIMEMVSPVGAVYQAGTLSGNPVAMAAGIAQLTILKNNPQIYEELNQKSDTFFETMKENVRKSGHAWQVNHVGSIGSLFFTEQQVVDYASAKTSDTAEYARYFKYMLDNGTHLAPAQFEAMFVSAAHTEENLAYALQKAENFLMCK